MDAFPRCFLLVFAQLAVGGFMALTVPPFHDLERGFYKSSAGVYLGAALLALAGLIALLARMPAGDALRYAEVGAWTVFCVCACAYVVSLWGEHIQRRARAFALTLLSGVIALAIAAQTYRVAGPLSLEAVLYPVNFMLSALLLGAASTGMMLGHWYLIDPGLPIDPLMRILRLFVGTLTAQVVAAFLTLLIVWLGGAESTLAQVRLLLGEHSVLLVVRIIAGPLAAFALGAMIWRTLLIPQTMAATGLFYIATLSVIVGEFLGRFILFRTSLPL